MKQPLDAQLQQQQLEDCAEKATTMTDGNELVVIGSESLQVCFLVSRPQELTESMAFKFPVSQTLMRLQSTTIIQTTAGPVLIQKFVKQAGFSELSLASLAKHSNCKVLSMNLLEVPSSITSIYHSYMAPRELSCVDIICQDMV